MYILATSNTAQLEQNIQLQDVNIQQPQEANEQQQSQDEQPCKSVDNIVHPLDLMVCRKKPNIKKFM